MIRGGQRAVALLVAAALGVAAAIALVELILLALDRSSWIVARDTWAGWLRSNAWDDAAVLLASIGAVALGVALVVVGVAPGRPLVYPSHGGRAGVLRKGLERAVEHEVRGVEGVQRARVRGRRRRVDVRVEKGRTGSDSGVRGEVEAAARRVIERSAIDQPPSVRVRAKEQQ